MIFFLLSFVFISRAYYYSHCVFVGFFLVFLEEKKTSRKKTNQESVDDGDSKLIRNLAQALQRTRAHPHTDTARLFVIHLLTLLHPPSPPFVGLQNEYIFSMC